MALHLGAFTIDIWYVLGLVFNPVALVIAVGLGWYADQIQKVFLAAFVAYFFALTFSAWQFGGDGPKNVRMAKFLMDFLLLYFVGLFWAWLAFRARPWIRQQTGFG